MTDSIVGIDLGTTNSLIGAIIDGAPRLFADDGGAELLPSVVGADSAGRVLVGREAKNRRLVDPVGTVVEVKRRMGTNAQLRVGRRALSAPQVSALILTALLDRAERRLGTRPERAVITVPAFFDDGQRQATRDAGLLAGLRVERLVNEPTAAALTHQTGAEELVLVYDFGGGTFDVSILERTEGLLEVRTSRGDTELGGSDIDRALVAGVLERLGTRRSVVEKDAHALTRLQEAIERAKIALSERDKVRVFEPFLSGEGDEAVHLDTHFTRAELETLAKPFVERTLSCIDAALRDAGLSARDLDRILLVGGTSKMPCVARMVAAHLGRPVLVDPDADRAVALGAAMLAGRAAGLDVSDVLIDITPHTLAVGALENTGASAEDFDERDLIAVPIIRRDTAVPVERSHTLQTRLENQEAVHIPVVQGEHRLLGANTEIGVVQIEDLPEGPAGAPVEVRFRLDLSGVLEVTATHVPSGRQARVEIAESPARLTEQRRTAAQRELESLRANGSAPPQPGPPEVDVALTRALITRSDRALATLDPSQKAAEAALRVQSARDALALALETAPGDLLARSDALADALLDLV